MDTRHLQEQLDQLQELIGELSVDEAKRMRLHGLVEDIEMELSTGSQGLSEDSGLQDRLDELVSNFETEHPTIAGVLKDIMVKLASIGV